MKATYHPAIHKFALFIVGWTIFLLTAGALVTSEDAALAVPDWPLSYGSLNPPMVGGIFYEHSHRMIAGALGLLIIVLAISLWRKEERPWVRWLGVGAFIGVCVQGALGGLTVLQLLHYWLPVMHGSVAQIMLALLVIIAIVTSEWYVGHQPLFEDRGSPGIHSIVVWNACIVYLQVVFGAAFRHKYSSIHPHLAGAVIVLAMVIYTAAVLKRRFADSPAISRVRVMLHALVGTQVILGLLAYIARLQSVNDPQPMPWTVAITVIHTVVGALLFATCVATVVIVYRLVPRKRAVVFATEGQTA